MIEIEKLKRNDRIWKDYSNGDTQEFIVWEVKQSEDGAWWADIDYADDDYCKTIGHLDEEDYYFK